ncbi:gliding motility protein [Streptomyces sp. NPDC001843]|uniref:gliding motility protein n=1 Tax=Streptomyces sp. NPDC001843 TaxID=3364617 RepID=UPI00368EA530
MTAVPAAESGAAATEAEAPEGGETGQTGTAEATEIPKQQSAEEAADNEAGDGART